MVENTLNELERSFQYLINILESKVELNKNLEDYLEYVKKKFSFFKENGVKKDPNGVLKIYTLGQSISRYADEFDWGDYSNKREVNKSLDKIYELIIKLDNEIK